MRFTAGLAVTVAVLLGISQSTLAQEPPPPNDLCAGAEVVPSTGPFPFFSSIVNITNATTTADPPFPSCGFLVSRSVWYKFTPNQSGFYIFSCGKDTATTVFDTVMSLYSSPSDCSGPFTQLECNDDSGVTLSALGADLQAGTDYYIVIWQFSDLAPDESQTSVQLKVSKPDLPSNDTPAGAFEIPTNGPFPFLTPVTDNSLATESGDPPIPSCIETNENIAFFYRRSLWYKVTPGSTSDHIISTCSDTATTTFDTLLAVYTSANGDAGPFTEVACDDSGCDDRSLITMNMEGGTTYYIVVWDKEEEPIFSETEVQLRVTMAGSATTLPPSNITSTQAQFNGSVNPNGRLTQFWFEYGTNTSYGTRSAVKILFGSSPLTVTNFVLTGIVPDQVYHYRMVSINNSIQSAGEDQTAVFSTSTFLDTPVGPITTNGQFRLTFSGSVGQVYDVEASTNFMNWMTLGQASELSPGSFEFIDTDAANHPARYYRLNSP